MWLHLRKFIHTCYSEPWMSSEEYLLIDEDNSSFFETDESTKDFANEWGEYIDDEYTERGWSVKHQMVDLPPIKYIQEQIEKSENKYKDGLKEFKLWVATETEYFVSSNKKKYSSEES